MTKFIQVTTTTETKEDGLKIAQAILEKRLAACVQVVGPVASMYWWKENIETAKKWLCVIKSKKEMYRELAWMIQQNHPYDVPEILVTSIATGDPEYLRWLDSEI
jgi:periplasmic divalent cation tolerance protein